MSLCLLMIALTLYHEYLFKKKIVFKPKKERKKEKRETRVQSFFAVEPLSPVQQIFARSAILE